MKVCPACQTTYSEDKKFCRRCGAALQPEGALSPQIKAKLELFQGRLAKNPENPEILREYGAYLLSQEMTGEAEKVLLQALSLAPENIAARETLVALYQGRRDLDNVIAQLLILLELQPDNLTWLRQLAEAYQASGRLEEAAAIWQRLSERHPEDPTFLEKRLGVLKEIGDAAALVAVCREILARQPEHLEAWTLLATQLQTSGQREPALEAWRAVLARQPDHAQANLYVGIRAHDQAWQGDQAAWPEAETHLSRALAQQEQLAPLEGLLARLFRLHLQLSRPAGTPLAALELSEQLTLLNRQADILAVDQNYLEILAECNYLLGQAYEAAGQLEEAAVWYRQALAHKDAEPWRLSLAKLRLAQGQTLLEQKKYGAARQVLADGLRYNPADPQLFHLHSLARGQQWRRFLLFGGAAASVFLAGLILAAVSFYGQGALAIRVEPPAQITLKSGSRVIASQEGETLKTPLLRSGQYELLVEKAGYAPLKQTIQVPWGRHVTQMDLNLQPLYGSLQVDSQPPGAQVKVRNQYQEKSAVTPTVLTELYALPSTIEVHLPDYLPFKVEKVIPAHEVLNLGTVEFVGSLQVNSEPAGAEVFINKEKKGTTPLRVDRLPAKLSRLEIRQAGVGRYLADVKILPGYLVDLGLIPLAQVGAIQVGSKPAGARVFVDERFTGEAPLVQSLPAGEHLIRVEALGYEPFQTKIQLKAEELVDLKTVSLVPRKPGTTAPSMASPPATQLPSDPLQQPQAGELWQQALSLFKAKKFPEAIAQLQASLEIDPNNPRAYYLLGWTHNQLEQFTEAVTAFQQAIRLQERFALAYDGLGWTYNQLGRHAEARDACQQAIRLEPNFPEAHLNLGRAYVGLGEPDKAIQQYRILGRLKPEAANILLAAIKQKYPDWEQRSPTATMPSTAPSQDEAASVARLYFQRIQDKDVAGALSMYAAAKLPAIKRHIIESVARDTEYYRIDKATTLVNDGQRARVEVYLYHKKKQQLQEYWVTTFELVREAGEWKIWATPGKRLY